MNLIFRGLTVLLTLIGNEAVFAFLVLVTLLILESWLLFPEQKDMDV